jgi:hypothetical protein
LAYVTELRGDPKRVSQPVDDYNSYEDIEKIRHKRKAQGGGSGGEGGQGGQGGQNGQGDGRGEGNFPLTKFLFLKNSDIVRGFSFNNLLIFRN